MVEWAAMVVADRAAAYANLLLRSETLRGLLYAGVSVEAKRLFWIILCKYCIGVLVVFSASIGNNIGRLVLQKTVAVVTWCL